MTDHEPPSIDEQVLSKARDAAEQRDRWLRRLAAFVDETADRVTALEETVLAMGREKADPAPAYPHLCGKLLVVRAGGVEHRCTIPATDGFHHTHRDEDGCTQDDRRILR